MIKSIYATVRLHVKTDGEFSEVFENIFGVKQGEPLSPLIFIFFINDIAGELETNNNDDFVSVNGILIHLLLFADDTVLFGKTPEALQLLLDKLLKYCSKWNIEVNKDKTEIIVFRNGWQQVNHSWYYVKHELKVMNSFVYLGNLFHYNGKFQQTQKRLSQQANKGLASLFNLFKMLYTSTQQKCEMFDSLVGSILCYGSEIWGFHHANDIEQVHNKFCRFVLKVGKNSPICAVIGELGHLPMHIIRKQRILKYWLKIVTKKPPIVFDVYKMLVNDAENGKTTGRQMFVPC
ncbi:uncharacterized protein [Mytilus edulis]|uniref:uncharacterized protein n=1 Tax=Mytilus edulis TaxID=6550 RepID=UPI0039F0C0CD